MPVQLQSTTFLLPKSDHTAAECEDAVATDNAVGRYAIADGAAEAFDSGTWARLLVESWITTDVSALTGTQFSQWLADRGGELHASWKGLQLPWYAEEKARMGSFATFVGLEISVADDLPAWRAIALGDSCIIQTGGKRAESGWPVAAWTDFNSAPLLVPSGLESQRAVLPRVSETSGSLAADEILMLMSDALACWWMKFAESDEICARLINSLFDERNDTALAELVKSEREAGRLKDDDIAVIAIRHAPDR